MLQHICKKKYLNAKRRKTPAIFYFPKEGDEYCIDVISTLEKLSESFPLVFCFIVKTKNFPVIDKNNRLTYENVYSFKNSSLNQTVSGTSYSELFNLFRNTFKLCIEEYLESFLNLLNYEYSIQVKREFLSNYEPNYKELAKLHIYKTLPIARHRYTDLEYSFLSSLKDCRMQSKKVFYKSTYTRIFKNFQTQDEISKKERFPKFPDSEIKFKAISPPIPKIVEALKRKKIGSRYHYN